MVDKIVASSIEIVLPTSTHTPLISTPMETTNEPTKHVEKQRKSIYFNVFQHKWTEDICCTMLLALDKQPTSMYSESICSDSETHHNRVLTCKQQMRRQKECLPMGSHEGTLFDSE